MPLGGENNEQAWLLLSLLSHCLPMKDVNWAVQYYQDHGHHQDWHTLQLVLKVTLIFFAIYLVILL